MFKGAMTIEAAKAEIATAFATWAIGFCDGDGVALGADELSVLVEILGELGHVREALAL